jgi:sec-independent protein translocase protein TatA
MPNIGPIEVAIVAIIALIIFGPKRLPELGKSLGDGMREFKASISGENDDDDDDDEDDLPQLENGVEEDDDEEEAADEKGADERSAEESTPEPENPTAEPAERTSS